MKKPDIEKEITERFLEILSEKVGPRKQFRFKKSFALAIGLSQQGLVKIEKGSSVQYRYLVALHDLFAVNMNWALTGKGEKYLSSNNGEIKTSKSIEERLSKLEKLIGASGVQSSKLKQERRIAQR